VFGEAAPLLLDPELDLVAISLVVLVSCLILAGFLWTTKHLLEPILSAFSGQGGNIFERVLNWAIGVVTAPVRWAASHIAHYIAEALAGVQAAVGRWFHAITHVFTAAYREIADLSATVAKALWTLAWVTVPRLIAAALHPVAVLARWAYGHLHELESLARVLGFTGLVSLLRFLHTVAVDTYKAITYVERQGFSSLAGFFSRIKTWLDELASWQTWARALGFYSLLSLLKHVYYSVAVTIPHELEILRGDLRSWLKYKDQLLKLLTEAGLAAAVVAALSKLLGFDPFCRNNRNLGKWTCGLDSSLLDLLLAGFLTMELVDNVEELAKIAQGVVGDLESVLQAIASE
jgi:hypothetical protein